MCCCLWCPGSRRRQPSLPPVLAARLHRARLADDRGDRRCVQASDHAQHDDLSLVFGQRGDRCQHRLGGQPLRDDIGGIRCHLRLIDHAKPRRQRLPAVSRASPVNRPPPGDGKQPRPERLLIPPEAGQLGNHVQPNAAPSTGPVSARKPPAASKTPLPERASPVSLRFVAAQDDATCKASSATCSDRRDSAESRSTPSTSSIWRSRSYKVGRATWARLAAAALLPPASR